MRPVFADPKTDLVFKRIFGVKAQQKLLIALLNDLLALSGVHRIVDLDYLPAEQVPPIDGRKLSIVDVKCTDQGGVRYIVEMQVLNVEGFEKRLVYNLCKRGSSAAATTMGPRRNNLRSPNADASRLASLLLGHLPTGKLPRRASPSGRLSVRLCASCFAAAPTRS